MASGLLTAALIAPHPAFGNLLPAARGEGIKQSPRHAGRRNKRQAPRHAWRGNKAQRPLLSFSPYSGEKVAEGRMRGAFRAAHRRTPPSRPAVRRSGFSREPSCQHRPHQQATTGCPCGAPLLPRRRQPGTLQAHTMTARLFVGAASVAIGLLPRKDPSGLKALLQRAPSGDANPCRPEHGAAHGDCRIS